MQKRLQLSAVKFDTDGTLFFYINKIGTEEGRDYLMTHSILTVTPIENLDERLAQHLQQVGTPDALDAGRVTFQTLDAIRNAVIDEGTRDAYRKRAAAADPAQDEPPA